MVLKEGKMTTAEIAEWFGVKKKSYTSNTDKYLSKLHLFAEFEKIYGGVIIKKILYDTYDKGIGFDDEYFNKEVVRCVKEQQGLATISGISRKARVEEKRYKELSYSQVERRMSAAGERQFGKYGNANGGISGQRNRIWAIKVDNINTYRLFTEEEKAFFVRLIKTKYTSAPDDALMLKLKLEEQLRNKEISSEEYFALLDLHDLNFFSAIIQTFKDLTGYQIVLATEYEMRAWENAPEEKN